MHARQRFGALLTRTALAALLGACAGDVGGPAVTFGGPPGAAAQGVDGGLDGALSGGNGGADGPRYDDAGVELAPVFEALAPSAYVNKVKSLLTGRPASAEDIARGAQGKEALAALIGEWQATPDYEARMVDFFTTAFQQGDVTASLIANATPFQQGFLDDRVIQNMRESFGRTAMALVREGRPFTDVLTTRRYMLTPALAMAMAWLDERQSGDGGGVDDALTNKLGPNAKYVMQADTPIPLSESVNPASASYLHFYAPQVAAQSGDCRKAFTVDLDNRITLYTHTMGETLMMFFMGQRVQRGFCVYQGSGILDESDFTTWRMVSLRKPLAGEERHWVYDIPSLRSARELRFVRPYVGFYTTPSFLYTWQTNSSNQGRVTINQTLIAALGRRFDGSLSVEPASKAAIATDHVDQGTACYACHLNLDPMRRYFRSAFSYYWGLQDDKNELANGPVYAYDGVTHRGGDLADLGATLAQSPRFATAWVQKLCIWANGAVCDPSGSLDADFSDPELLRIADAFRSSDHDFDAMVRDLFSSPLVTYAAETETTKARGASYAVAKKAHFCQRLDVRLGLSDACGLHALPTTDSGDPVKTIASVLPSDAYSRGQNVPTLANDPGLFFYAGVEKVCAVLARRVVDVDARSKFRSGELDLALVSLARELMGVAPPEDDALVSALRSHYDAARATGADAATALRSTFMLACMSAATVGVGP